MRKRAGSYTDYSIGCALVWAVVWIVVGRRADADTRKAVRTGALGWWSGWTSATIARVVYPPPRRWSG